MAQFRHQNMGGLRFDLVPANHVGAAQFRYFLGIPTFASLRFVTTTMISQNEWKTSKIKSFVLLLTHTGTTKAQLVVRHSNRYIISPCRTSNKDCMVQSNVWKPSPTRIWIDHTWSFRVRGLPSKYFRVSCYFKLLHNTIHHYCGKQPNLEIPTGQPSETSGLFRNLWSASVSGASGGSIYQRRERVVWNHYTWFLHKHEPTTEFQWNPRWHLTATRTAIPIPRWSSK